MVIIADYVAIGVSVMSKECIAEDCNNKAITRGCCDKHYRRLMKFGDVNNCGSHKVSTKSTAIERFHDKYEIDIKTGCWNWIAGTRPNSKGDLYSRHFNEKGRSEGGHRFSYRRLVGEIPKGMFVCHRCDNPLCVNPNHLFLGTHKDNMEDMTRKNRQYKGNGEMANSSKLTNKQAMEIRKLYPSLSQSKIADMFCISQASVGRIVRGETYVSA